MNVQTIEMDPAVARERLEAYRGALRRSADAEYEAAVAGYEALAEGTPVIQYGEAIRDAPRDEKGRPMLAVARADRTQVRVSWGGSVVQFDCTVEFRQSVTVSSLLIVDVQMGETSPAVYWRDTLGFALIPMVPPEALAAIGGRSNLRKHLILWEVEEWADRPIQAVPDRDPLLLRPIHGDLCAVVAAWDLTDLERAVMAGRRGG